MEEEVLRCGGGGAGCGTKQVITVGLWGKVAFEQRRGSEGVSQPGFGGRAVQASELSCSKGPGAHCLACVLCTLGMGPYLASQGGRFLGGVDMQA